MMNEFKTPIKKAWQTASKPVETVAPIIATAAPTGAPTVVGAIWIDTEGKDIYISVGIASSSDWRLIVQD
jgi:hypothetical protein